MSEGGDIRRADSEDEESEGRGKVERKGSGGKVRLTNDSVSLGVLRFLRPFFFHLGACPREKAP